MSTYIFDGKEESLGLDNKVVRYLDKTDDNNTLLIVQVGENSVSEKYIKVKEAYCAKVGIKVSTEYIKGNVTLSELTQRIQELFAPTGITGGIVQLPLPNQILSEALKSIPPEKDIDCLSHSKFISPVLRSTMHFISKARIDLKDAKVLVIGGGPLVGEPAIHYFSSQGAQVFLSDNDSVFDIRYQKYPQLKKVKYYERGDHLSFDLILSSVGKPAFLDPQDICEGAAFIDFGSSVVRGKTVGDLDYIKGTEHLSALAPSPKGMGPLVVRYLVMNLLGI